MNDNPGARLAAFVARRMRNVGVAKTLLALAYVDTMLQAVAVVHRAFAIQHVGDRLDVFMIMRFRHRTWRHRHDIHANLLRTDRLLGCARTINDALFAEVSLPR